MDDISHNKAVPFLVSIVIALLITSILSFHRYYIKRDYMLYARMECDSEIEECLSDEYGEYLEAYRKASEVPLCLSEYENICEELTSY